MLQSSIRRRAGTSNTRLRDASPSSDKYKKKDWYVYPLCGLAVVLLIMVLYVAFFSSYGVFAGKTAAQQHILRSTSGMNADINNNNNEDLSKLGSDAIKIKERNNIDNNNNNDNDNDNDNSNSNDDNNNNNNDIDSIDNSNDDNDRGDSDSEDGGGDSNDGEENGRRHRLRRGEGKSRFADDYKADRFRRKIKNREKVKEVLDRKRRYKQDLEDGEDLGGHFGYGRDSEEGHDPNDPTNRRPNLHGRPRHERGRAPFDPMDEIMGRNRDGPGDWRERFGRDGVNPRRPPPEVFEERMRARREGRPVFDGRERRDPRREREARSRDSEERRGDSEEGRGDSEEGRGEDSEEGRGEDSEEGRGEEGHGNGNPDNNPPMPCRDRGAPVLCEQILQKGECQKKGDICAKTCGYCKDNVNAERDGMAIPGRGEPRL